MGGEKSWLEKRSCLTSILLFLQKDEEYPFLGTTQDTVENLKMNDKLYALMRAAAEVAGQIALRLTHDHELFLDFERYDEELLAFQEKFLPYDRDVRVRKALACTESL